MKGKTHIVTGIACSCAVSTFYLNQSLDPVSFAELSAVTTIGSLLADIDHANSTLGSKIPLFSKIFKHRGFTHTVYFLLIVIFLLKILNIDDIYILYMGIGMLSHILGDILTPMGLTPFKIGFDILDFKIRIPIIQNDLIENIVYYGILMCIPFLII